MRIWLDDERPEPEGWVRCVCVLEILDLLKKEKVEEISLDYDLGHPGYGNGKQVLEWILSEMENGYEPPAEITAHTGNREVRFEMHALIRRIHEKAAKNRSSLNFSDSDT